MGQCVWTDSPLPYNLKGSDALGCVMCGHCSDSAISAPPPLAFLILPNGSFYSFLGWAGQHMQSQEKVLFDSGTSCLIFTIPNSFLPTYP